MDFDVNKLTIKVTSLSIQKEDELGNFKVTIGGFYAGDILLGDNDSSVILFNHKLTKKDEKLLIDAAISIK